MCKDSAACSGIKLQLLQPAADCFAQLVAGEDATQTGAHARDRVGAGRKTRQKSATKAMTTFAATKSISFMKLSCRLLYSADDLVKRPMPTCRHRITCGQRQVRAGVQTLTCRAYLNGNLDNEAGICQQALPHAPADFGSDQFLPAPIVESIASRRRTQSPAKAQECCPADLGSASASALTGARPSVPLPCLQGCIHRSACCTRSLVFSAAAAV